MTFDDFTKEDDVWLANKRLPAPKTAPSAINETNTTTSTTTDQNTNDFDCQHNQDEQIVNTMNDNSQQQQPQEQQQQHHGQQTIYLAINQPLQTQQLPQINSLYPNPNNNTIAALLPRNGLIGNNVTMTSTTTLLSLPNSNEQKQ
jgi:hypothetical protein